MVYLLPSMLRRSSNEACDLADRLATMNHSQAEFLLLNSCVASKIMHLTRMVPREFLLIAFAKLDVARKSKVNMLLVLLWMITGGLGPSSLLVWPALDCMTLI